MSAALLSDTPCPVWYWGAALEPETERQLRHLAELPHLFRHVAAMADAHPGIGATVGAVLASESMVIPAAVGVDIGCGVSALRLALEGAWLRAPGRPQALRRAIEAAVPVGFAQHRADGLGGAARAWAEEHLSPRRLRARLDKSVWAKARLQLGTLGGGNHFIELCTDDQDRVWLLLHSGSRHVGKCIAEHHMRAAKEAMRAAGTLGTLPDPNLAYLAAGTRGFDDYVADVTWAQDYARVNRAEMARAILAAIAPEVDGGTDGDTDGVPPDVTPRRKGRRRRGEGREDGGVAVAERVDCHHNYVARETHFGRPLYVTRKGALSARAGEAAVIPGSMGAASYIVEGKGEPESFHSCAHGAGRAMSRGAAKRRFTVADLTRQTDGVECRKDKGVLDEIPTAYKDIEEVMARQADLVTIRHRLRQWVCVKG